MKMREYNWNRCFQEIKDYIDLHHRRPSKYKSEERTMIYWLKYNKRRMAQGLLSDKQAARLKELLELDDRYRRLNQYRYSDKDELPLF